MDRKTTWLVALAVALSLGVLSWVATNPRVDIFQRSVPMRVGDVRHMKLPDFNQIQDTFDRKIAFFEFIKRLIYVENTSIRQRRAKVKEAIGDLQQGLALSESVAHDIQNWLDKYGVEDAISDVRTLNRLLKRMDVIPASLAMAQAANESAWGTSRFAREGNNLFGQWCFRAGCGIAPAERPPGATHEVRVFAFPFDSVAAYVHNLNTHRTYAKLRNLRLALRESGKPVTGLALVDGLHGYSQEGTRYVRWITQIIVKNNLTPADRHLGTAGY